MTDQIVPRSKSPAAMDLDALQRWAKVFVASGMFPSLSSREGNAAIAKAVVKIQCGQELGLAPFQSMRGIHIIDGQASFSSELTAALVKMSGVYDYTVEHSDALSCTLRWWKHGEEYGLSSYAIEEAKQAGLAGKKNWQRNPADMLFWRALSRGARRFCPEIFLTALGPADPWEDSAEDELVEIVEAEPSVIDDEPPLVLPEDITEPPLPEGALEHHHAAVTIVTDQLQRGVAVPTGDRDSMLHALSRMDPEHVVFYIEWMLGVFDDAWPGWAEVAEAIEPLYEAARGAIQDAQNDEDIESSMASAEQELAPAGGQA